MDTELNPKSEYRNLKPTLEDQNLEEILVPRIWNFQMVSKFGFRGSSFACDVAHTSAWDGKR